MLCVLNCAWTPTRTRAPSRLPVGWKLCQNSTSTRGLKCVFGRNVSLMFTRAAQATRSATTGTMQMAKVVPKSWTRVLWKVLIRNPVTHAVERKTELCRNHKAKCSSTLVISWMCLKLYQYHFKGNCVGNYCKLFENETKEKTEFDRNKQRVF